MAQWDLSTKMAPFLDAHLFLHILNFVGEKCEEEDAAAAPGPRRWYASSDILKAKLDVAKKTGMCDFVEELYHQIHGAEAPLPEEMRQRRTDVVAGLRTAQANCIDFLKEFSVAIAQSNQEKVETFRKDGKFTVEHLKTYSWMNDKTLDSLYAFGKCQYEVSNYNYAAEAVYWCRLLSTGNSEKRDISSMWGKLSAEILNENWSAAEGDRKNIREMLDKPPHDKQPQARAWLLHWSLFIFFNYKESRTDILGDMFLNDKFMVAVQLCAPHLLRYIATAIVISNKKDRKKVMDLVRILDQEKLNYSDPITEFLCRLYLRCDFEGAQEKLKECKDVLLNDFFTVSLTPEFEERARQLVFSDYCRAHNVVNIKMVAEKLDMDLEKAEGWIVNLIRDARLDACIDSKANQVIMTQPERSIFQRVEEQSKALTFRTEALITSIQDKRGALDGIL